MPQQGRTGQKALRVGLAAPDVLLGDDDLDDLTDRTAASTARTSSRCAPVTMAIGNIVVGERLDQPHRVGGDGVVLGDQLAVALLTQFQQGVDFGGTPAISMAFSTISRSLWPSK